MGGMVRGGAWRGGGAGRGRAGRDADGSVRPGNNRPFVADSVMRGVCSERVLEVRVVARHAQEQVL